MSQILRYQCDRCHAESNGNISGWWSVWTTMGQVVIEAVRPAGREGNMVHLCGMDHALAEVSERLRGMQKP